MSNFSTKKYTRPVLTANVSKLPTNVFTDATTLARALSPRAGAKSAQFAALKRYVNLKEAFEAKSTRSVKQYIVRALSSSGKYSSSK